MKKFYALVMMLLFGSLLWSQEVAEDEFLGTEPIEFTHYTGEYDNINTLEEIQGIGRVLSSGIDIMKTGRADYGHFYLIHSYQPEIPQGLDGDILVLTETSGVDHVRNLRHIIAGFLEDSYGYSYDRAYLLAEFITYYNAVNYQKIEHFQERYKPGVTEVLTPDRCGLSRIFSEWPGKARIVIPLRNPNQEGLSSIDTSIISEDEVIQEMQKEEDQNLDERKDMVELREEENQQEESTLVEERDNLEENQQQLEEEKEQLQEELSNLEEKEETQGLTAEEEQEKVELQQQVEEKEEQIADVEEQIEEVEEKEAELDQRNEEVLDMRDEIAKDENKQIEEGTDGQEPSDEESVFVSADEQGPVPMHFFHYQGNEDGIPFGQIYLYDLTSSSKTAESTITTLYGREYTEYNSLFLSIGKNRSSGDIHLMLIDKENLGLVSESSETIFPGSRLVVDQSNQVYALCQSDGDWVVGRFNQNLEIQSKSNQAADPFTDILFYNGKIFIQDPSGTMVELNFQTLASEKEYK